MEVIFHKADIMLKCNTLAKGYSGRILIALVVYSMGWGGGVRVEEE